MSRQANHGLITSNNLFGKIQLLACTVVALLFVAFPSAFASDENSGRDNPDHSVDLFAPSAGISYSRFSTPGTNLASPHTPELFIPGERNTERSPDLRPLLGKEPNTRSFASPDANRIIWATLLPTVMPAPNLVFVQPWWRESSAPAPQLYSWQVGFWSVQAAMWGSVILDGMVSGDGPYCVEANPRFRDSDGGFRRGNILP